MVDKLVVLINWSCVCLVKTLGYSALCSFRLKDAGTSSSTSLEGDKHIKKKPAGENEKESSVPAYPVLILLFFLVIRIRLHLLTRWVLTKLNQQLATVSYARQETAG